MRRLAVAILLVSLATSALAQRGRPGTGDTTAYRVPWRYLEPGVTPSADPLVLDWFPASREEIEHSELLRSRPLTDYAGQCIGMQVILPEDKQRIAKFGVEASRPVVLLVEGDGKVVHTVGPEHGMLRVADVEKMLENELNARGSVIVQQLNDASVKQKNGDRKAAIDLYQKVWDQRCLFPFAAHEAERGLRQLGVAVNAPAPPTKKSS